MLLFYFLFLLLALSVSIEYYVREEKIPANQVNDRALKLFFLIFIPSVVFSFLLDLFGVFIGTLSAFLEIFFAILLFFAIRKKSLEWLKLPKKGDLVNALWNGSKVKGTFTGKKNGYLIVQDSDGQEYFCKKRSVWKSSHN